MACFVSRYETQRVIVSRHDCDCVEAHTIGMCLIIRGRDRQQHEKKTHKLLALLALQNSKLGTFCRLGE